MPHSNVQARRHQAGAVNANPRNGARNQPPIRLAQEPLVARYSSQSQALGTYRTKCGMEQRQQQQQQQHAGPGYYRSRNRLEKDNNCDQQNEGTGMQTHKPQLFVKYTALSIRRVFVASEDPGVSWQTTPLKFQPVSKTSLAHLSGESMYTLALGETPQQVRERTAELYTQAAVRAYERSTPTAKPLTAREVADSVTDNLYADMSSAMDCARSYLESRYWDGVKPKLWLRFGTMLFHSRQSRSNLADHRPFDPEGLQQLVHGPKNEFSVLKTFDTGLSDYHHRKMRATIGGDRQAEALTKQKFIIHVADATKPGSSLIITCRRTIVINPDSPPLTICKVRNEPLRHMVADVACMARELDLRLILTTRQDFTGDMSDLQAIVNKARYIVGADGGLTWPQGGSTSGPYTVKGSSHLMQTTYRAQGCKWKLRHAHRTSEDAPGSRYSYELDVTVDAWGEQFTDWKVYYKAGQCVRGGSQFVNYFFKPLSTLVSWVWTNCI